MKFINITVKAKVTDALYGKVSDEAWEKYQNGEISGWNLYTNYFDEYEAFSHNLDYEVTKIEEIEEEEI